jgi:hypothetical protein
VYNLNPNNKYGDEWDVLESKVKKYTKIYETSGWENASCNNKITNMKIPQNDLLFSNIY